MELKLGYSLVVCKEDLISFEGMIRYRGKISGCCLIFPVISWLACFGLRTKNLDIHGKLLFQPAYWQKTLQLLFIGLVLVTVNSQMKRKFRKVKVPKETYEETSGVEDSGILTIMTDEGEGLPYAPEDFPLPGDKWRWRVGKRVSITGYHRDRFLYPPARLFQGKNSRNKHGFASKVSAERYIRREFPDTDVAAFFASFSWMVPAKRSHSENGWIPF